jgi:hypothetical protein
MFSGERAPGFPEIEDRRRDIRHHLQSINNSSLSASSRQRLISFRSGAARMKH